MASLPSRPRRLLRAGAPILIVLILAGATYQGVATALERRAFPHPGGLVSVGDHQLHLYCVGDGLPTVVLEAPAAGASSAWVGVQGPLSAMTRVCSYDRAGLGWSEAGDRPYDPGRVPEELRTLLSEAQERGPFVVVGHGLGAAYARMYAARPDSEAAALILVNPPGDRRVATQMRWFMASAPWLARAGVLRAGHLLSRHADVIGDGSGNAMRTFLDRPGHVSRAAAEFARWDDALRMADETGLDTALPVVTVGVAGEGPIAFLHAEDAQRVVAAIEAAIQSARSPGELP